jgi:hypothetical protein
VPEQWAVRFMQAYGYLQDDAPPALLYLAVRAARRAVAADPNDYKAYGSLGASYMLLRQATRERAWVDRLPPIGELRSAQASAALNRAVALKPDYAEARRQLGELYLELGYEDLALEQLAAHLQLMQSGGPRGGDPREFRAQVAQSQVRVNALADAMKKANDDYTLAAAGKPILGRVKAALTYGLAGKARDMLLESDISAFGQEGMMLEMELLLRTGRARDVYKWTGPDQQAAPENAVIYHWLRAQALAASGEYALAEEEIAEMAPSAGLGEKLPPEGPREAMAKAVAFQIMQECPGAGLPQQLPGVIGRGKFFNALANIGQDLRQNANTTVLWGLLALEQGDAVNAKLAFRRALDTWRDEAAAASGAGLDFQGRVIAQQCLEWLEEK